MVSADANTLRAVLSKDIDALVIDGFMPPEQCAAMVDRLPELGAEIRKSIPFGEIYGQTLVSSPADLHDYFAQADALREETSRILKYDITTDLQDLFQKVPEMHDLQALGNGPNTYTPMTMRRYRPGKGGLHAHAEAEFVAQLPEFADVRSQIDVGSQINFLLMLQAPEKGGELALYDLKWSNSPAELKGKEGFYDHYQGREQVIEQYRQEHIDLRTGQLLLFNGIEIWHAVRDIGGNKDRVTLAGFIARRQDGKGYILYN